MSLFRNIFRREKVERELDAEVRGYSSMIEDENRASGLNNAEARRAAGIELGGVEQVKEQVRAVRAGAWLESLWRDARFAARSLRKTPGFTAIAILTLALGIGANAAIFSVLEAQLWRPLSFPDSERLVEAYVALHDNSWQWDVLPERVFRAWHTQSHFFSGLAASLYPQYRNVTANGTSERLQVMPISHDFFDTLQMPPAQGREFTAGDEAPGRDREAIVSYSLWQNRFGSDPNLIGKQIAIDGEPYSVIGIAAPGLTLEYFDPEPEIFVPLAWDPAVVQRNLYAIGRLAPGASIASARAELEGILEQQLKAEPIDPEPIAGLMNLRETWTRGETKSLYFFAGAVLLVLLIACVNIAGLLLARGLARQREFALRSALGAGFGTLIRQSLVESLLLSLTGSAAGTVLGVWLSSSLTYLIPAETLPRRAPVEFDVRVLLFALGMSVFSALVVGVAPGIFASRVDANRILGQNSRSSSPGVMQRRLRSALVATEVALGLILLFGAGLFLSSFQRLVTAPRGFDAPGALTFHVSLRGDQYSKPDEIQRYFSQLNDAVASLPGVRQVSLGSGLPLTGSSLWGNINPAGRPLLHKFGSYVEIFAVSPNYFDALHLHLLAGRALSPQDSASSQRVAVINRNTAQELFGNEDPVGKVLDFISQPKRGVLPIPPVQIVGVMENFHINNANEPLFDMICVPFVQWSTPSAYALVKSDLPRGALAAAIRDAAYKLDKNQPISDLKTMDDRIDDSVTNARFDMYLAAGLAFTAVILVGVGIFGTVAYFVHQRTQEFGIRLALGAKPARILQHAISQALAMGLAGLAGGIGVSLILGRLLQHTLYLGPHSFGMLYSVSIYDPLTLSLACALLIAVLVLASLIPARRAMKVDPMVALRYE
jgi:putative ABC transport system permease protein